MHSPGLVAATVAAIRWGVWPVVGSYKYTGTDGGELIHVSNGGGCLTG